MPVLEDAKNNSLCHKDNMITMAMGQWMIFKTYKMADKGEKECWQKFLFILDLSQLLFVLVTINWEHTQGREKPFLSYNS